MTNPCGRCGEDSLVTIFVFVRDEGRQLWCLKCVEAKKFCSSLSDSAQGEKP